MSDTDGEDYGLVMPFVTVASAGGPHADEPYVAGYQMGHLHGTLEPQLTGYYDAIVDAASVHQADLIAMQYGYTMRAGEEQDGWVHVEFARDWDAIENFDRGNMS